LEKSLSKTPFLDNADIPTKIADGWRSRRWRESRRLSWAPRPSASPQLFASPLRGITELIPTKAARSWGITVAKTTVDGGKFCFCEF